MSRHRSLARIALLSLAAGCSDAAPPRTPIAAPTLTPISVPAPEGSSSPGLTVGATGRLFLSWQTRLPDSSIVLHYAVRQGEAWAPVVAVPTSGVPTIASATDVPSITELPNGVIAAAWRGKHSARGYDILYASSRDAGSTWSAPRSPHRDGTSMEHGFVSWVQLGDTSAMVWVDGRDNALADTAAQMTQLALAVIDSSGSVLRESFIDTKICDCCHTSAAVAAGASTVIAYRDRKDGEIRDISVARWTAGSWRLPVAVHEDGWHYQGCPVNGPAIAADGATVAVAWFTSAENTPRVRLAFSSDTATSFAKPIEVSEGSPDGKVGLVLLPSGDAIVSWIDREQQEAVLRVRRIARNGDRSAAVDVARLGDGKRAGGMPKLVLASGEAMLGYTDPTTNRAAVVRVQ